MKGVSDYAVVYDISCDLERARVDKTLKSFGFRVQKSVFECKLDKKGRNNLIEKLRGLDIKTGFIKIYRLEYSLKNELIGEPKGKNIDDGPAFIV
jgi:CRISPR-associated protein Cas2